MKDFIKRLDELEAKAKAIAGECPDLVIIFYSEDLKSWIAEETYGCGKNCRTREIRIPDPKKYVLPEGFSGTFIVDDGDSMR